MAGVCSRYNVRSDWLSAASRQGIILGKYKTWTPGPWTPSVDRVHGPPIFTTPKITEVNKNKIKSKLK